MSFSDYTENKILDHLFKNVSYTSPTTVYAALFTADPTDTGALTDELSNHANYSSGYARVAITFGSASGGATDNTSDVTFSAITTTGNITVTHMAIIDSATLGAGNILASGALTASKTLASGDSGKFSTGNLDVTLT